MSRKTLRKSLAQGGYDPEAILGATGIDGTQRPEMLTPEQFMQLSEAHVKIGG